MATSSEGAQVQPSHLEHDVDPRDTTVSDYCEISTQDIQFKEKDPDHTYVKVRFDTGDNRGSTPLGRESAEAQIKGNGAENSRV